MVMYMMDTDISLSFSCKVNTFISSLGVTDTSTEKQLIKEIIKFILKISNETKKQTYVLKNKFARLGFRTEIDRFQNDYLNISYYTLRVLYPAIVNKIQNKPQSLSDILQKDVDFCISYLTDKDISNFKENTKDYDTPTYNSFDSFVGSDCWIQNYDKLYGYIRSKVGKLSFILKDDPSLDMEDCVQEILLGVVKVYNIDPKAFRNKKYVDMAISNQINTLLNYYTRSKRKRYFSDHDAKYEKIKALKKKKCYEEAENIKKTITDIPEYHSNLCEADLVLNKMAIEINYDEKLLLKEILEKAKSNKVISNYCDILLGNDLEFNKWSKNSNINCYTSLSKEAKKYIGFKYKDVHITNWNKYICSSLQIAI